MLDERIIFVLLAGLLAALLWECAQLAFRVRRFLRALYCAIGIMMYVITIEFVNPFAIMAGTDSTVDMGLTLTFVAFFFLMPAVLIASQNRVLGSEETDEAIQVSVNTNERSLQGAAWLLLCTAMCIVAFEIFRSHGPELLLTLLAVAWATDTGAYFIGRAIGQRKIAKRISPNKTVAGTVGGYGIGFVVGLLFGFAWLMDSAQWGSMRIVIAAATLPVLAIIGDLLESIFKRLVAAKESGGMLPGHGGLLDRLDSVVLTSGAMAVFAFY